MSSFPIIENVTLSFANISNEIYSLLKPIRPDWTSSNTRVVTFTEGLANVMLGIFDTRMIDDDSNALLVKLYGAQTELYLDRESEINAMKILSEYNVVTQRVLIQFNNGIVYEYTSGRTCSKEEMKKENLARLIAIKLAQFHNVPIEGNEKPYSILLLRKFIELLKYSSFDLSSIISDIDALEERILPSLIPNPKLGKDLVLCHNDLNAQNIIYNEKNQSVSFIDFEYAHINYALFDIANHFVEYCGVNNPDTSSYPTRDEQKRWLGIYFQARGMDQQIIDDDLCHRIQKLSSLSYLMWGLWGLIQAQISQLDFDYTTYANICLNCYKNLRSLLFEKEFI